MAAVLSLGGLVGSAADVLQDLPVAGYDHTFYINDLRDVADQTPGDGVCGTRFTLEDSSRSCTLYAAVQEANALPAGDSVLIVPAAQMRTVTGTFVTDAKINLQWNTTNNPTPQVTDMSTSMTANAGIAATIDGDIRSRYWVRHDNVVLDFQSRLGFTLASDTGNDNILLFTGANQTFRNFTSMLTTESSVYIGATARNVSIINGEIVNPSTGAADTSNYAIERSIVIVEGAQNTVIRNVVFQRAYWDAILLANAANAAYVIDGLTIDRNSWSQPINNGGFDPVYNFFVRNWSAAVNGRNVSITNNTISGWSQDGGGSDVIDINGGTWQDVDIRGNIFTGTVNAAYNPISIQSVAGGPVKIHDNSFVWAGSGNLSSLENRSWVYVASTSTVSVYDNTINGGGNAVNLRTGALANVVPTFRNTMTGVAGTATAATENGLNASNNIYNVGNNQMRTVWPSVAVTGTNPGQPCSIAVTVQPPTTTGGNLVTGPVLVDAYIGRSSALGGDNMGLEQYLGRVSTTTTALPATFDFGYTGSGEGQNIRLQTTEVSTGRTSAYSRTVSASGTDLCGPQTWIKQGGWRSEEGTITSAQEDPTTFRQVAFDIASSEQLGTDGLVAADIQFAGTAPGAQVVSLTQVGATRWRMVAKANGSGTIVPTLPAGTVGDTTGNANEDPSNSTVAPVDFAGFVDASQIEGIAGGDVDDSVLYQAPLRIATSTAGVVESATDGPESLANLRVAYTPEVMTGDRVDKVPQFPVTFAAQWGAVVPDATVPTITPPQTAADIVAFPGATLTSSVDGVDLPVQAVDNTVFDGTRSVPVGFVLTSDDPEFDGLVLDASTANGSTVTVEDNDAPDVTLSQLTVTGGGRLADGVETHTATLTVRNADSQPVQNVPTSLAVPAGVSVGGVSGPTTVEAVSGSDGVATVTMTSVAPGLYGVDAFVGESREQVGTTENVLFTALPADAGLSSLTVTTGARVADGVDTHMVTATARSATGETALSTLFTFQVAGGTLSDASCVTGVSGTCSVLLTSTVAGDAVVRAFVNGTQEIGGSPGTGTFVAGPPSLVTSTISADRLTLPVGGEVTSTITVALRDALGNPLVVGGADVEITTASGTLSAVVDNGDGTYTATLTSPTVAGATTIRYQIDGVFSSSFLTINFVAGAPSASTSTIVADPVTVTADGVSESTITVTLVDGYGNQVATGGEFVVVTTTSGVLSSALATDNGDGTYTTTLRAPTTAGSATVRFAMGAVPGGSTEVVFTPGAADAETSTITADPSSITADGLSQSAVTVVLADAFGNRLSVGGDAVTISSDAGTLLPVVDNGDGSYTAVLTSSSTPGVATLSFAVNAVDGPDTATVTFVVGEVDLTTSTIVADPVSVTADGVEESTVTVTARDAQGNVLTDGGADVDISADLGTVSSVVDNGDGTYTATIASTVSGTATLSFEVNGMVGASTATVDFTAGEADAASSTITADPTSVPADGVTASTITVTLLDVQGNRLLVGGDDVEITSDLGTVSDVTDNADGTYTATLLSTVAGTAEVSFAVGGVAGTSTATVALTAGVADPGTSTIVAAPVSVVADGTALSTVTVTLLDAQGNPVGAGSDVVDILSDLGTVSDVTDNGDGTYTATVLSTLAGTAEVSFTVNGAEGVATATVTFTPGAADLGTSTIVADRVSLTADGLDSTPITVTLLDANGNQLTAGGGDVVITSDLGTVTGTSDNGDGTYSATLTSAPAAGTATVGFTVAAATAADTVSVAFVAGAASTTTSQIAAAPGTIIANGTSTSTVTVQLKDGQGNDLTASGGTVVVSSDVGSVSGTTDNGDGTYTATLTSTTLAQTATLAFTIDAAPATSTTSVVFVAGAASAETSVISASPPTITADGASTATVLVQLRDVYGNPLTIPGGLVVVSSDLGTVSATTDNGNGTYTATLTSAVTAGTATLSFTLDTVAGGTTATVELVAGAASLTTSLISATPASITADGAATSSVTVQLTDSQGNPLTAGGVDVVITTTSGVVGPTTDNGDGTYTATLTSATTAGTATLGFRIADVPAFRTTAVTFVAGAASAATSEIGALPDAITADGLSTSQLTVRLRDAQGNALTSSGGVVVVTSDLGTVSATTDNGDGTYTATLTSATTAGTAQVGFTLDGSPADASATVRFIAGSASSATSTIEADPTTILADGTATSQVTVQLKDAAGNNLTTSGGTVIVTTTLGTVTPTMDNGDGTYTATLRSVVEPGTATLSFTIGGAGADDTATVDLVVGAADPTTSFIASSTLQLVADGEAQATLTVHLRDAAGNSLAVPGGVVVISTTLGDVTATDDNGDGTYTATLTAPTTVGSATVGFTLDGDTGSNTLVITFVEGEASAATSTLTAAPTTITADGVEVSTLTVQLVDGYGNPVTSSGGTVVITSDLGTVSATTDNGDGTYTATLSGTVAGAATARFTIDGDLATSSARIDLEPGAADTTTSGISVSPASITADGISTSAVTVRLRDAQGNDLTSSGGTVVITTDDGSISTTTDNGDGSYTATLTSATLVGEATVGFTVDGSAGNATATVAFVAGLPDPTTSVISADPTQILADGSSTSTVTVQLRDAQGNDLTSSGGPVTMTTDVGTLGATTDNLDGTYTAELTSTTLAQVATVSYSVGATTGGSTTSVEFVAGDADPTLSVISADPAQIVADGSSTSTVTVRLRDANGNPLTASGGVVVISTDIGSVGPTTDAGDGTYSAVLTSATTAGTATVGFTLDGSSGPTAAVTFVAGPVDATQSVISADPTQIVADGSSTSDLTVRLKDGNGNDVTVSGGPVVISTDAGSVTAATDNGDGTYSAILTSPTTAGTAHLTFTVSGQPATATAEVTLVADVADAGTSTIEADPTQITADGSSTSAVTVRLLDVNGNPLTASGGAVVISADLGSVGGTTDNGDGTYTATLTAGTVTGTATLAFTLDGAAGGHTADVVLVADVADAGTSTIEADPTEITADGSSTSAVTVRLLDVNGNPLTASGGTVVISADLGSVGGTTDNGDGTYTATLTAGTAAGTATLTFTLDGTTGADSTEVELVADVADAGTSTIEADPTEIAADGSSTSAVTVRLLDASGNPLTASGGTVVIATDLGSVGTTTDNGDGTYTATLVAGTVAGTATLTFTLDGAAGTDTATVALTPGTADSGTSTIEADPTQITADGSSTSEVTVRLLDVNGNPLTTSGGTVVISTDLGSVGATTDNGDGTYSATLTAPSTAGTASLSFTLDGSQASQTATVDLVPGPVAASTSTIEASPTDLPADGSSTSAVTVRLLDVNGNPLTASGGTVVVVTDLGSVGVVVDNLDGTYSATLTAGTVAGTATLTFTLDGTAGDDSATVDLLPGAASTETSTIEADPVQITADGSSTSEVTVRLLDANGNPLTTSGGTVVISADLGSVGGTTDNGDGTYTATLTSATAAGTATVGYTLDGAAGQQDVSVRFVAGGADVTASTIVADPTEITADGLSTSAVTVRLLDVNGNPLTASGGTVVISTDLGSVGATTDNGDGTYSATLTSGTLAQTATVGFTLDDVPGLQQEEVAFVAGAAHLGLSTIEADPTEITADGVSTSTVTVRLVDANGNPLAVSGGTVLITTDVGTVGPTTDNGDGTSSAVLTAPTAAGTATLGFSVDATTADQTATVDFVAGAADPAQTTISAFPTTLVADGSSTSAITVQLRDANGNPVGTGGPVVVVATGSGSVSATVDNGDGTYSATLTSATVAGTGTLGFTLDGTTGAQTATVTFVAGAPDAGRSVIAADPTTITADGVSTSAVTVQLVDAFDNPLTSSGGTVVVMTDDGTVSATTDNGDGTYSALLTSASSAGVATVSFSLDGTLGTSTVDVAFVAGVADPTRSTIDAAPDRIVADGVSTSLVTVRLNDSQGNPLTSSGGAVVITADRGAVGPTSDNGDGTYTASLRSETTTARATVGFTLDGSVAPATTEVAFVAGVASPVTSTISASPLTILADGASTSEVTVQLKDGFGNNLVASGGTVVLTTTGGTVTSAVDNSDGTYTATLTSDPVPGTAVVSFTIGGLPATDTESVDFVVGAADPTTSVLSASVLTLVVGDEVGSTLTVQLKDATGNNLTTSGGTVVIAADAGTVTATTDNGDGTYTATLTAPIVVGQAVVSYTLDGTAGANTLLVTFVEGVASPAISEIEATPAVVVADGLDQSVLVVRLKDGYGNSLTTSGGTVAMTTTRGTVSAVTDNGDGTYQAVLTGTSAGPATVRFTIDGNLASATAAVQLVPGAADPGRSTIVASPVTVVADGVSSSAITVRLFDAQGNALRASGGVVTMASDLGDLGAVTDNGDGSYTATLVAPTASGLATVTYSVDGAAGAGTAQVTFGAGPASTVTSTVVALPTRIESDGVEQSILTVHLKDGFGNDVTTAGDVVVIRTSLGTVSATAADGPGAYSATLTSTTVGTATVSFTVGGVVAEAVATVEVVDERAPAPPVISLPVDGSRVPPTVQISGSGEPGATVTVLNGSGAEVCTAVVTTSGTWSCGPVAPFPEGPVTFVAVQRDASGNLSERSGAVTVVVDGTPPTAPSIDVTDGSVVTGVAEPGSEVTIVDQGGNVLCTTTAAADGSFSCALTEPVPDGTLLGVYVTDEAGNRSEVVLIRVGGPSLRLELSSLNPGSTQTAYGRGFLPGESVSGLLQSTPVDLGVLVADENGSVTYTFVVPEGIEVGEHSVTLTGEKSGAVSATFEVVAPDVTPPPVTPPPTTVPPTAGPTIPATGAEVGWPLGAAVVALLLGAVLVLGARRRRSGGA